MRQYVKRFEELNESFFKRAKSFFGGGDDVENNYENEPFGGGDDVENNYENEPDMDAEYRDIVERLKMSFDEPRAISHYMEELQRMGRWKEFITSEEGEDFKEAVIAFRRDA